MAVADLTEVGHGNGPITWMELWSIGSFAHGAGWPIRVMYYANSWENFQINDSKPDGWNTLDPNDYISKKNRSLLRQKYHEGNFLHAKDELLWFCEEAGKKGLTQSQMNSLGLSTRRRTALVEGDLLFMEGDRNIHFTFAPEFPDNAQARIANTKHLNEKTKQLNTPIHGSERRERQQGNSRKRSPAVSR